jgi:hypothetical protein
LSHSIVFSVHGSPEESTLIPASCPVPVRRSSHLNLSAEAESCDIKILLRNESTGDKTLIAEVITTRAKMSSFFVE